MNDFKQKITKKIINIGKRHRAFTKPVIAVLTLFLAVYYGAAGLLDMFRCKKFRMRTACLSAAGIMIFTQINPLLASQEANGRRQEAASYEWFTADENADVFQIGSLQELIGLQKLSEGYALINGSYRRENFSGKKILLTEDIDFSGCEWNPIYGFKGEFDGGGHTLSGFDSDTAGAKSLFLSLQGTDADNRIVISNLVIDGFKIISTGNNVGALTNTAKFVDFKNITVRNTIVKGSECVGGMVGLLTGNSSMTGCRAESTVYVSASGTFGKAGGLAGYANQAYCDTVDCTNTACCDYTGIKYIGGGAGDSLRIVWDSRNNTVRVQHNDGSGSWCDFYYPGGAENSIGNASAVALYFEADGVKYQLNTEYFKGKVSDASMTCLEARSDSSIKVSSDKRTLTVKWLDQPIGGTGNTVDFIIKYSYNGGGTFSRNFTVVPHGVDLSDVKISYGGDTYFAGDDRGYDYAIWPTPGNDGTKMLFIKKNNDSSSPAMYISSAEADGYYTGSYGSGKGWAEKFLTGNHTNNGSARVDQGYYLRWDVGNIADGESTTVTATEGVDMSGTPVRILVPDIPPIVVDQSTPDTVVDFVFANVTDTDYEIVDINVTAPDGSPVDVAVDPIVGTIPVPSGDSINVPVTISVNTVPAMPEKVNVILTAVDNEGNITEVVSTINLTLNYLITYDYAANGGFGADESELTATEQVLGNTDVELSGESVKQANREGWEFVGWNTDPDAQAALDSLTVMQNTTLYAIYKKNVTGMFYVNNGSNGFEQIDTTIYNKNPGTVTPALPENDIYVFGGWYTEPDGGVRVDSDGSVPIDADGSFYAHWGDPICTLTFDYQGAMAGNTVTDKTVSYNAPYGELPAPEKTGFSFKGWYTQPDGGGSLIKADTIVKTPNDHTLHAFWEDVTAPDKPVLQEGVVLPGDWTNSQKTIPLILSDNMGVTQLWVSIDGADYAQVPASLTGLARADYDYAPVLEGRHTYRFKAKDAAGIESDESDIFTVNLDTEKPSVVSLKYNQVYKDFLNWIIRKKDLVITVNVTDGYSPRTAESLAAGAKSTSGTAMAAGGMASSGVTEIRYTLISENGDATDTKTVPVTGQSAEITVNEDWKGDVRIVCADAAGNVSDSVTVSTGGKGGIIVEDTAPVVKFSVDGNELSEQRYDTAPSLKITVTDDRKASDGETVVISGGIAYITYRIGDGEPVTASYDGGDSTGLTYKAEIVINSYDIPYGDTEISVTAVDNAGNSTGQITRTVKVKKKDEITVELHRGGTDGDRVGQTKEADANGDFSFEGIPDGIYSLVVKKTFSDGRVQVITDMIEVKNSRASGRVLTAPGELDTRLEVYPATLSIAVDGLSGLYDPKRPSADNDRGITSDDLGSIAAGADIEIRMVAKKLSEALAADDAKAIQNRIGDERKIGMLFDLSVYKELTLNGEKINGAKLTELTDSLTVGIMLPEEMQGYSDYAVARLHGGVVEILDTEYDEDIQTLKFESDRFSVYAVIYKEHKDVAASYMSQPDPDPAVPVVSFFVWIAAITLISLVVMQDCAEKQRAKDSRRVKVKA